MQKPTLPHPRQLLLGASSLLIALLLGACSKTAKVESSLERAAEFLAAENYAAAEIEYKNALQADERNAIAIARLGEVYFQQGRFRQAFPFLNTAQQLDPQDADNLFRLGTIQLIAGQRDESQDSLSAVLRLQPKHAQAPLSLVDFADSPDKAKQLQSLLSTLPDTPARLTAEGMLALRMQNVSQASQKFDEALKQDPNFAPAYLGRFAILGAKGDLEAAEAALETAVSKAPARSPIHLRHYQYFASIKRDPAKASAHLAAVLEKAPDYLPILSLQSELLAQQQKNKEASELVDRALRLDPIDMNALRTKGSLLTIDKKPKQAIDVLNEFLKIYPNDIKGHYSIALAYLAEGEKAKAKIHLTAVSSAAPGNFEAAALLASLQLDANEVSEAVITLKRLNAQRPDSPEAKLLLAEAYNRQGNYEAALAIYQQVESAAPENPQLDYLSGLTHLRKQDAKKARESFEAALAANPLHLQSVEQLTALDLREQSYESALQRIDNAIAQTPETAVLYVVKAQIHRAMGDSDTAIANFQRALELDPKNRNALMLLARLYVSLNQNEQALASYQSLVAIYPEDITALSSIASLQEQAKELDKAKRTYAKILEINANVFAALNNLAYLTSITEGPTDKALAYAERARELGPNNPFASDTLGWILYQRGDYTRAKALLSDAVSKLGNIPEVQYHYGAVNYMLGDEIEAQRALAAATPENADAYTGLDTAKAKLEILAIKPSNASDAEVQLIKQSIKTNPKDPTARAKLGLIAFQAGDTSGAIELFRTALKDVPDNATASIGLARALARQGSFAEALELTRATARLSPNNPEAILVQGEVAYLSGDHQWASSLLANRLLADNAAAQAKLAEALLALGRLTPAIEAADKAQALAPTSSHASLAEGLKALQAGEVLSSAKSSSPELYHQLALALQKADTNASDAVASLEAILKGFPQQAQAQLALARLLSPSASNAARVFELASAAAKTLATSQEARALQGIAQYQQGQYRQAITYFQGLDLRGNPTWQAYQGLATKANGDAAKAQELLEKIDLNALPPALATQVQEALAQ